MGKSAALLLVLVFVIASCMFVAKPAFSYAKVAENTWVAKASMHEARSGLGVAVLNGKIYAIGGSTLQGSAPWTGGIVGTNEEYDPATDTWVFKKPMPTPRMDFGIVVYNNKIYCIGGEEIFKDDNRAPLTNVNEAYDPLTDTWETKAPMPTPRSGLRANMENGKIYLIGGYDPNVHFEPGSSTHNEVYDPATDSWTTKAPMPNAASKYASAVFGDKIYIIGGYIGGASEGLRFGLNQVYNTKTDRWSFGVPLLEGYGGAIAGATSGMMAPKRIYVFGEMKNLGEELKYSVRVYNPENDSWTIGADIPTDRSDFGVAIVDDIVYVIGGATAYPPNISFGSQPPTITKYATNEQYIPIGYGTITPIAYLVFPQNQTYNTTSVPLIFTVDRSTAWIGYSLDGWENITINGNTTIANLSNGLHNVTVYAKDTFGNIAASETVNFSVAYKAESIPPMPVAAASVAVIAGVGAGLLVYFKKRGRGQSP